MIKVSRERVIIGLLVYTFTFFIATTLGEFVVAVHNRYSVYPTGSDTNMYGNSTFVSLVFVLLMSFVSTRLFYQKLNKESVLFGLLVLFSFFIGIRFVPSFIPEKWCVQELTIYSCEHYDTGNRAIEFLSK